MPIAPAWREVGSQEGGPVNRTFIICLSGESPQGSQVKTSQCFWTPHGSPRGRAYISAGAEIPFSARLPYRGIFDSASVPVSSLAGLTVPSAAIRWRRCWQ